MPSEASLITGNDFMRSTLTQDVSEVVTAKFLFCLLSQDDEMGLRDRTAPPRARGSPAHVARVSRHGHEALPLMLHGLVSAVGAIDNSPPTFAVTPRRCEQSGFGGFPTLAELRLTVAAAVYAR